MSKCELSAYSTCCSKIAFWIKEAIMQHNIVLLSKHVDNGFKAIQVKEQIKQIKSLIKQGNMVYIAILPDHHFFLMRDYAHPNNINIFQSFIGEYSMKIWIDYYTNIGKRQSKSFSFIFKTLWIIVIMLMKPGTKR